MAKHVYGIPGNLVHFEGKDSTCLIGLVDPAPGSDKQLIHIGDDSMISLSYVKHDDTLLPHNLRVPHVSRKYMHYLFYAAVGGSEDVSYVDFLTHILPSTKQMDESFVCILLNTGENECGYAWLDDNILLVRRPDVGREIGAFTDALHICCLDSRLDHDFKIVFMSDYSSSPLVPRWLRHDLFQHVVSHLSQRIKLCSDVFETTSIFATDNIGLAIGMKAGVFAHSNYNVYELFAQSIQHAGFHVANVQKTNPNELVQKMIAYYTQLKDEYRQKEIK